MAASGIIRVGTCSWTEKSLIESGEFYPKAAMNSEERLKYYAARFDTVEVDATYYAIPPLHTVELWAERSPPGFTFHVKAYGALTGHGIDPRTLPRELRELLPAAEREKRSVHLTDPSLLAVVADAFAASLAPLRTAGKLGLVVFQFPPRFRYERNGLARILACRELTGDLPLAVEFRHGSWLSDRHRSGVLGFLRDHGFCYVTADEPQYGTPVTVPFLPAATTDVAYLRLHGRNADAWLKKGGESRERYDYLYAAGELEEIAGAARQLAARARVVFVMFNNCRAGHAMKNALEMLHLLG
jgi:uncharacterized protein YecE (DUF72 family)